MASGTYTLGFEDIHGAGSDMDFNDIVLTLSNYLDNTIKVKVTSKDAAYHFDLVNANSGAVMGSRLGEAGGPSPIGTEFLLRGRLPGDSTTSTGTSGTTTTTPPAGTSGGTTTPTAGTPGFSTDSSYGLNNAVDRVFGDAQKVFGLDYRTAVADIVDNWLATPYAVKGTLVFARHAGQVNVLRADGSVGLTGNPKRLLDPAVGDNGTKVWLP